MSTAIETGATAVPAPTGAELDVASRPRRIERNRRRDTYLRRLLGLADLVAFAGAFGASVLVLGDDHLGIGAIAMPPLLLLAAKVMGLYDRDPHVIHKTTLEEVPKLAAIAAFTVLFLFFSGDLIIDGRIGRDQALGIIVSLLVLMIALRAGARWLWRVTTLSERCLLVGNPSREQSLRDAMELNEAAHVSLVGVLPIAANGNRAEDRPVIGDATIDELDVDRVVVAPGLHGADELMFLIAELRDAGVKVSVIPDVSQLAGGSVELDPVGGLTLLGMRKFAITRSSWMIKRGFDLVAASLLLALLAPLMAAIAIAIRLENREAPILFRQLRVGRHGREFRILKFRSMDDGAHARREDYRQLDRSAAGFFKAPDDPRVTGVGRRIRAASLDELPQLVNVIRGEMSLVGPRPLIPEEDANIAGEHRRRLDVPPGMTGHWQVLGSALVPLDEMVRLDYLYVANWSLWGDIVLMVRTLPRVLRRRSM